MRKFMPSIPRIVASICSVSIAGGFLLWLDSKDIHPEQWVAKMIGVAENGVTEYLWILLLLLGFAGLIGLFIGPLIWNYRSKLFSHKKEDNPSTDGVGDNEDIVNELEQRLKFGHDILLIKDIATMWAAKDQWEFDRRLSELRTLARAGKIRVEKMKGEKVNPDTKVYVEDVIKVLRSGNV